MIPGIVAQTALSAPLPPATYPYTLPFVNADASDASNAMFEIYGGGAPGRNSGRFSGAASAAWAAWGQTFDIPEQYWADIDANRVRVTAGVYILGFSGDTDNGYFYVEAIDANNGVMDVSTYPGFLDPASLTLYEYTFILPPGTRKVRMATRSRRNTGTELSIYYDDFYGSLTYEGSAPAKEIFFGLDPSTTSGWTPVTGTLATSTNNRFGQRQLKFSADASGQSYRDVVIPSKFLSDVDAGTATIDIKTWAVDFDGTSRDLCRFLYQFLDASNTVLGSVETHAATTGPSIWDIPFGSQFTDQAVPTGTRKIRIRYYGTRNDGSNLDAGPTRIIMAMG